MHASSESGGVLVLVAVTLPVVIMLASFVIDVGNWYEHKRHLQLQVVGDGLAVGHIDGSETADDDKREDKQAPEYPQYPAH